MKEDLKRNSQQAILDDRRFAALHQAAQAVMIVWLGGWIRWVEISGVGYGKCDRTEFGFRSGRYTGRVYACISLAGWLSEVRYRGSGEGGLETEELNKDLIAGIRAARRHGEAAPRELADDETTLWPTDAEAVAPLRQFEADAKGILAQPGIWDAINAVARELMTEGVLIGDKVVECIEEYMSEEIDFIGFAGRHSRSDPQKRGDEPAAEWA